MNAITAAVDDIAAMPRSECVSLGLSTEVKSCSFGMPGAATHVVLLGDSHAIQWFNPFERIAAARRWWLTTLVKSGCPASDLDVSENGFAGGPDCVVWRERAFREIERMHPALVVVASSSNFVGRNRRAADAPAIAIATWQEATRRTLARITAMGIRAVLMADTPTAPFDVPTCLARSVRHAWYSAANCAIPRAYALEPAVFAAERSSADGLAGVTFVDMTPYLCGERVCSATRDGIIVYRDDNHLTGRFAATLAAELEPRLVRALDRPAPTPSNPLRASR